MEITLKELNYLTSAEYWEGYHDGYHEAIREAINEIGKKYKPKR